jgi:peptidoglycan-N-acetylglucosamine deacetylase
VSKGVFTLEKGIIVHFKKPTDWNVAYIHYWSTVPGNLQTTWPGVAMKPEEDGWYYFSLKDQTAIHIVFNNNGQPQTQDLYLDKPEGWFQLGDLWTFNPDRLKQFSFPQGKYKALVMSFDDGNLQDKKLIDIFNANGIRGTFHLNSGLMGNSDKVPAAEVKSVYAGHEVSGHSKTHPYLDSMNQTQLEQEILDDKKALEALVGYPVRGLSYPFGSYSQLLLSLLPGWGFVYGRVVPATNDFRLPNDLLLWRGSCHHSGASTLGAKLLTYATPEMALLFVWGHSWELDGNAENNSWQYMEDFCKTMGKKSDIWYATAIEVADYLRAVQAAELSLTGEDITNPSELSIWVKKQGQVVELKPHEALSLK